MLRKQINRNSAYPVRAIATAALAATLSTHAGAWGSLDDVAKSLGKLGEEKIGEIKERLGGLGGLGNSGDRQKESTTEALALAAWTQLQLSQSERDPNPSADQKNLYSYADNYRLQGAVVGGLVGAVAGCLVAKNVMKSDCPKGVVYGAAIGGGIGYVVGGRVGQRQDIYAQKEADLSSKLAAAEADLADAKRARAAAERVVSARKTELTSLKRDYKRNRISRNEYVKRVGYATKDLEALTASKKGLEMQIASARQALDEAKPVMPGEKERMKRLVIQLEAENTAMDNSLRALAGVVETARVYEA